MKTLKAELLMRRKQLAIFRKSANKQNADLRRKNKKLKESVNKIFSPCQIKRLKTGKQSRFSEEVISKSIALFSLSKKAYLYALKQMYYPLPSISTLRKRVAHLKIKPGFLDISFKLLSTVTNIDDFNSYIVLSFDETNVESEYAYSVSEDKVYPPIRKLWLSWQRRYLPAQKLLSSLALIKK